MRARATLRDAMARASTSTSKDNLQTLASARSLKISKSGRIISKEDQEHGGVSWLVYRDLVAQFGVLRALFLAACLLGGQAAYIMGDYWLASWAASDDSSKSRSYWIWVYAIFVGSILLISVVRAQVFFRSSLRASSSLHKAAIERLMRAPLSFFHTNPSGRVLCVLTSTDVRSLFARPDSGDGRSSTPILVSRVSGIGPDSLTRATRFARSPGTAFRRTSGSSTSSCQPSALTACRPA